MGRLLIPERLWLTTMRCAAIVVDKRCISNTWWTINTRSADPDDDRILALWLNSTFGLVLWIYSAEETRGPWLAVKKSKLSDMPVLDVKGLSRSGRRKLLACWNEVQHSELAPISQVIEDRELSHFCWCNCRVGDWFSRSLPSRPSSNRA